MKKNSPAPRKNVLLGLCFCLAAGGLVLAVLFSGGPGVSARTPTPTPTPPPPPPSLTATAGKASVTLAWSAVGTDVTYKAFKSSSGASGSFSYLQESVYANRTDTLQVDSNVYNGLTYYYYMEACNGGGCSYSGVSSATVTLDAPTASASPGQALITISWGAVAYADSYLVYRSANGGSFGLFTHYLTKVNPTTYVDNTVHNGVSYAYVVYASNNAGLSPAPGPVSANVNLAAPTGVRAVRVSSGVISVNWGAVTDATAYSVYSRAGATGTFSLTHDKDGNSSNTSATIQNINATSVYYFYIIASNRAGYSPPSAVAGTADVNNQPAGACCYDPSDPMLSAGPGAGSKGGSDGDPVNLATGAEVYTPEPDITVYNPNGPGVTWRRIYHGYQALRGYGSSGFSTGWSHPYDVTLQGPPAAGTWGALNVAYANGGGDPLTPELDAGGQPTGVLLTRPGASYLARGVPGANAGEWASVTITWKNQTEWRFTPHPSGLYTLERQTNRVGRGLGFTWNGDRTLAQVSDVTSGAALLTASYGAGGRLVSVADAYGRHVIYGYSAPFGTAPGRLERVSQVGAVGSTPPARWSFTYEPGGNGQQLKTISAPSPTGTGVSTATIFYDNRGRVETSVDANGIQRWVTYGAGSSQVQVKTPAGVTVMSWTQKFSASGRDTGTVDADNKSTSVEYNDPANPLLATRLVDKNGKATSYTYDQFGNVLSVTTPRNVTTVYTYDYTAFALGRLTKVKEGTKPATTFEYFEPSGLLKSVSSPSPMGTGTATTSYTYDALGNVLSVTRPGNNAAGQIITVYNYTTDGSYTQSAKAGQPLTATDNLGHKTHLRYDAQGRLASRTDALGHETNATYNLAGQLEEVTSPATGQSGAGRSRVVKSYLYAGGPPTSVTLYDESNVQARQVSYGYGVEGEVLSVSGSTEPASYTYDALYRLKTLKDGKNNTTTYNYDGVGNVSSVQMPGGETIQFPLYDPSGRVLRRIDGNGVTTNYSYDDPENLLTDIQYPATPGLNVYFGYDAYGRRASMTDGAGSHAYTYGDLDELKSATTTYTGLPARTLTYQYNSDGSRQSMATPAGTFAYTYDGAGYLSGLTNPLSEATSWERDANGRVLNQYLANGAWTTYTHNAAGQLTGLTNSDSVGAILSQFGSIAYDGAGNRTQLTASFPGSAWLGGVTDYQYDGKDQLTQEQTTRGGGLADTFGYDAAGNPTSFRSQAKAYNANNQRTGAGYAHDHNGNPTTYGGTSLSFDPENRLTSYGAAMTAGYRGDGLRAWKESAQGRTYYLYDGTLPVVELDAAGAVTAANTFGGAALVSRRSGTQSTFYAFDPQGSVSQRMDAGGAVVSSHLFDAHGGELTAPGGDPFGYGAQWGYYTDRETGLQLLTHRYYDPQAGRFLTRDPIGYRGGINLYAYVTNSPTGFIDPYGFDKFTLPAEPGANGENLPEGWRKDTDHLSPNGERWVSPDGTEGLEFDRGIPGEYGNKGEDHWAKLKPKRHPKDKLEKDYSLGKGGHLYPGDVIDLNSCSVPAPYSPWPTLPNIPPPPPSAQLGVGGTIIVIAAGILWLALA